MEINMGQYDWNKHGLIQLEQTWVNTMGTNMG